MQKTILNVRTFKLYNSITRREHQYSLKQVKKCHPYLEVHPWKSLKTFSQYLLNNIIYNKGGLVAINKPYGISTKKQIINKDLNRTYTRIPNMVDYTIADAIPFIQEELGYSTLTIVKAPEKFMSGITLLATNTEIEEAINFSYVKSVSRNLLNKIYWVVTTRVPNEIEGNERLCLKKMLNPSRTSKAVVISDTWSHNEQKRNLVRILNVKYRLISNSTMNLSSLLEIRTSTIRWNAIRLYASTRLYAPILGDNLFASRIHKVGGTLVLTNPFLEVNRLPGVDRELLELLNLTQVKQEIIPCHIHARRILLPDFWDKESLILEAPLLQPFVWTCEQLKFKNIPELEKRESL